ncbi:MAG: 37S ribosomal protein S24, mitochondrial [Trizodia sp. TS-e1964]|nr:MAG: 37S ribosomal protein S24, mitochondrial [Trizodia sp. TS-e1964]
MASAAQGLKRKARTFGFRLPASFIYRPPCYISRPFSLSPQYQDDPNPSPLPTSEFSLSSLTPKAQEQYKLLSLDDREAFQRAYEAREQHFSLPETEDRLNNVVAKAVSEVIRDWPISGVEQPKIKQGFINMGETDLEGTGEDDEMDNDDITSIAHGELEQHREMRQYARIAAWEMPLLSKLSTPFQPPTDEQILRFRYTTYMGEQHPAEKKVVVQFSPLDLPSLTPIQVRKLVKLAGVRYNPETQVIKMSCEMFETQAQNKRYLGDLVDTLIHEAQVLPLPPPHAPSYNTTNRPQDPSDTFEDIPLDFRHHKLKSKPKFPLEWRMTPERQAQREALKALKVEGGSAAKPAEVVDGVKLIEKALSEVVPIPRPVMATQSAGKLRRR